VAEPKLDAIVIGGGHNALAAAVHMARRGMSVGVFEQSDKPGGAIRTEEVTLPGFRHDLYAMNLSLFAGSAFAADHAEELKRHGLAYAPASDCFATAFPDGRWLGISQDVETNAERIAAFDAGDAARWRALSEAFGRDAADYFAILGGRMTPLSLTRLVAGALRRKGRDWTMEAVRLLLSSPRDFLDATFESPRVKALLAPWAMHLDFPPDASGGAMFPYLEAMADQLFGMALGKGGADTVPNALAAYLAELECPVRTGTRVDRIEQVAGRATAVILSTGERVEAREAIVASVTPSGLLDLLGGTTGRLATDRKLATFRHGPGTLMIHVACEALPDWEAGEALQRFAYVHIAPTMRTLADAYDTAMAGDLPAEPAIVVGQPTAIDPSRAPEGKHILWIQVRVVPAVITGDEAGEIAPGPWSGAKEAMADRVMAIIERYAPGFGASVLARTVHAPDDLERANPNLVGGDSIGGSHHLRQNFVFRPALGMADHATPVGGLYMVGASTWPGAGVGAGSGYLVGRRVAGR
jgi:phytoene dehydrogenase-like protein